MILGLYWGTVKVILGLNPLVLGFRDILGLYWGNAKVILGLIWALEGPKPTSNPMEGAFRKEKLYKGRLVMLHVFGMGWK